jgi:FliI/YscN family ATPase
VKNAIPGNRLQQRLDELERLETCEVRGRITSLVGLVARAVLPDATVGEVVRIVSGGHEKSALGEIVGFEGNEALIMPLGQLSAIGMTSEVVRTGAGLTVAVGPELIGRVLDGLGHPRDVEKRGPLLATRRYPVSAPPPDPLHRRRITESLPLGVHAIDALLTCGKGQRLGVFAAAGVGKSTTLGMIARYAQADINVIALVGERGREVNEFIEDSLGPAMDKSVVVVATSDEPALVRLKAAHVATAIAESFRDQGKDVLFMMDSVTRFARAQREVGLATGEPPARAGFTPSVFSELPRLLERTGNSDTGSITAIYTILVEGDDMTEPVADEVRSILDGHIVLSRRLAEEGHYPAIDIAASKSRVMRQVITDAHAKDAQVVTAMIAAHQREREAVQFNIYKGGDKYLDEALARWPQLTAFLRQDLDATPLDFPACLAELARLVPGGLRK